jgi:hypothetical protein
LLRVLLVGALVLVDCGVSGAGVVDEVVAVALALRVPACLERGFGVVVVVIVLQVVVVVVVVVPDMLRLVVELSIAVVGVVIGGVVLEEPDTNDTCRSDVPTCVIEG